jgi:O-antigen/teichoic acid export membrane protein
MARRLSDKAAHLMLGEVLSSAVGIVTSMILVRVMTREMVGEWKVLMQVNMLVVNIFILGLPASLLYFVPRARDEERGVYIVQTVFGLFVLGLAAGVVLIVAAPFIAALYRQPDLAGVLPLFAVFVLFEMAVGYTRRLFLLYDKTVLMAALMVADPLGVLICFAAPAVRGYGLRTSVLWLGLYAGVRMIFTLFFALKGVRRSDFRFAPGLIGAQLWYSVPLGIAQAIPVISRNVDKLIMPIYLSAGTYAVYAVGATDIPLAWMISSAIAVVIQPRLAAMHMEGNREGLLDLWREATVRAALLILPFFALMVAVSDKVFVLFFTSQYEAGVWLFRTYLLVIPLYITMQRTVLAAFGKTKFVLAVSFLQTVCSAAASIALINWIGFYGPPIGVVCMAYLGTMALGLKLRYEIGAKWTRIWPLRRVLPVLGVSLLAGAAAYGAAHLFADRLLSCALATAIMGAVYAPLLFLFRLLDERDMDLLRLNWQRLMRLLGIAR